MKANIGIDIKFDTFNFEIYVCEVKQFFFK